MSPLARQALAALDAFGCESQADATALLNLWTRAEELTGRDHHEVIDAFPAYGRARSSEPAVRPLPFRTRRAGR